LSQIRFGTCSWKYDSWKGLIYPESSTFNYLEEYSKYYNTVEVDQWFWSLFDEILLPQPNVVNDYASSVPDGFLFTIKVPNSITLTHYYKQEKKNPHFLSNELFDQFLSSIEPLLKKTGSLIFQFEYFNKQKISSINQFMDPFRKFFEGLPKDCPPLSVEIRNPNYISENWFRFLSSMNISHVFLEGYFMPPISDIYRKYKQHIRELSIIRLHGPERKGIEELSGGNWNQVYVNRDRELSIIAEIIKDLQERTSILFVNVNNHYEGSAPLTINRLKSLQGLKPSPDI